MASPAASRKLWPRPGLRSSYQLCASAISCSASGRSSTADTQRVPCSLRRTSSHDTAELGSLRCSSHRRSSSAVCSGVKDNSVARCPSLRLSHRAIASSALSWAGSFNRSDKLPGTIASLVSWWVPCPGKLIQGSNTRNSSPVDAAAGRRVSAGSLQRAVTPRRRRALQRTDGVAASLRDVDLVASKAGQANGLAAAVAAPQRR